MRLLAAIVSLSMLPACTATRSNDSTVSGFSPNAPVAHYVFYSRDRERIVEPGFLNSRALVGAQLMYAWKELEPEEGVYDFSEIEHDLAYLSEHGKKLFIQLQDTTFSANTAVPAFLRTDPRFGGGVVNQYAADGSPEGWVAMRWHPEVQKQLQRLYAALGARFDGRIAGITLQETSIGLEDGGHALPDGFSYLGYRDAILANLGALKMAFPHAVVMQYANFMPGEWLPDDDQGLLRSVYEYARDHDIAVGSPDLLPHRKSQLDHAYRFMAELKESMTLGIAVQDGNYTGATGTEASDPAAPSLVPELDQFAKEKLGVKFIFWAAQEPYFALQVLPYLAETTPGS